MYTCTYSMYVQVIPAATGPVRSGVAGTPGAAVAPAGLFRDDVVLGHATSALLDAAQEIAQQGDLAVAQVLHQQVPSQNIVLIILITMY